MRFHIKICGITQLGDRALIASHGADYGGVLVEIDSPRGLPLAIARDLFDDPPLPMVAVTLDQPVERLVQFERELKPAALQLHGSEPAAIVRRLRKAVSCEIWKVLHLPAAECGGQVDVNETLNRIRQYKQAGVDRFLLDATVIREGTRQMGGTGRTVDWAAARKIRERADCSLFLAGGIHPGNAAEAARQVIPDGLDLSSGVESVPGIKDPEKVLQLIARVREAESAGLGDLTSNLFC
ncbi:MAG TPA: phosphoribosylanthranilate isomerase [bacterium]|nr:phosphoribosylanthranilate isomerase [Candidatus Omnitrophota bacterium]HOJ61454.1 phosphoribosylanthranilate isomerase [bacterium]HOL95133.1 phosphoribosylanthranilate isomerase [bacterium]HPO99869.1 phosphoribosylanthranilate isomerase [bacterium]HXK92125.1 phosphoribosylanthranilate isomerase [bacterium]